jgi:hypothetical protein
MPLLEAVYYAQTNVTLLAEIQCTLCLLVQNTRDTAVASLWKANAANVLLPVD